MRANPSSPHAEGRKAKAALEDARARVKAVLGWDGEVIFTSGASEAADIALRRASGGARLVSSAEHDAVLQAAPEAERLPVTSDGAVDLEILAEAIQRERPVVAVQQVNSETGNRQALEDVARLVKGADGLLIADCAQGAGKFALPRCDMAIIAAHKFGGPVGVGALLLKDFSVIAPSGGHERGYRRGTENLPAIMGMAAALEACGTPYIDAHILTPLDALADECRKLGGVWLADRLANPTSYIRALAMPGMSGSAQLMRFDMAGIAVSQGSACSSGTLKKSHVLEAMGLDDDTASRMIRVSFGWNTSRSDVERFCEVWSEMARGAA